MFEAYSVGVRLQLVDDVSRGLAAISRQFAKTDVQAKALQGRLTSIKNLAIGGVIIGGAGFMGLMTLKPAIDAASEYEKTFARFKTLNLGDHVNAEADKFARGTKTMAVSSSDLMETLRESVGMFGNIEAAKRMAPMLAELNAANSVLFGEKGQKLDERAIRAVMRFNDMRGLTDTPEQFMRGLNLAQRMITGSGGALKFTDLEAMAKRGGAAFKGLSDEGIMTLATLAQEQGGSMTGTALMSLYQNWIAGRTTKKTMAALSNAGLAELGMVTHGTVGGKAYKTMQIKNIVDEKMLRENPGLWLMTYGVEAAKKKGAKTDSEIIAFMNNLISNRTGSNMAANFTTQQFQAMRDLALVKNAKGVEGTIAEAHKTLPMKLFAFQKQWNTLLTELGLTVLPMANAALTRLIPAVRWIGEAIQRHPATVKGLAVAFTGLAGAMAIGGSVMVLAQGLKGLNLVFTALRGVAGVPSVTGALKGLIGVLNGPAGLCVAAAAAGLAIGTLIKSFIDMKIRDWTGDKHATLGTKLFDWFNPSYGKVNGVDYIKRGDKYVQVQSTVNLDGKKVGEAVTKHQVGVASKPQTGGFAYDTRMGLVPVGY